MVRRMTNVLAMVTVVASGVVGGVPQARPVEPRPAPKDSATNLVVPQGLPRTALARPGADRYVDARIPSRRRPERRLSAASPERIDVHGGWVEEVGCVPTDVDLDPGDPSEVAATCIGTTTFDGDWVGQEVAHSVATLDLATGDTTGSADATFTGTYLGDEEPSSGTLYIRDDVFNLDGSTGAFHVEGRIVGGDGAFAGSSGCVMYDGFIPGGSGHGGYWGIWFRGEPQGSLVVEEACATALWHPDTNGSPDSPILVRGGWIEDVPAFPTGPYTPSYDEPMTGTFVGAGSHTYDGDLQGQGVYTATGTIDLLTNTLHGEIDEIFTGTYAADDSHTVGQIHFRESFVVEGMKGSVWYDSRILGGEGGFAGSAGCLVGNGFLAGGAAGYGGYSLIWFRNEPAGSARVEQACASSRRLPG